MDTETKDLVEGVFSQLKAAAGDRGFTFLGRRVTQDMSFDDVLEKIPVGELETAASVGRALSIQTWKRVVPSAPPRAPGKGGAQQISIYKAASLVGAAEAAVKPSQPATQEPTADDDKKGIAGYIADAILGTESYRQNADRYVSDQNEPAILRFLVGGVRALEKGLDAPIAALAKNPLQVQLDKAYEFDMSELRKSQNAKALRQEQFRNQLPQLRQTWRPAITGKQQMR